MNIRYLLLFISLFFAIFSFSQSDNQNVEWRALNYYLNEQYDEAILECQRILESRSNDVAANRTRFILARAFMQTGEYEEALKLLRKTRLDAEFFEMGLEGMMGDCYSQQGNYEKALDFYIRSINADANELLTPHYLFKAYLCSKELDQPVEANRYLKTIIDYFPSYTGKYMIEKYLLSDTSTALSLSFREVKQPEKLGIGTVNGVPVSESAYYEAVQIAFTNARMQSQQSGQPMQEIDPDRVWKSFVEDKAILREYKRISLDTDDEEMMAYLLATDGYSVQPEFVHYDAFSDEEGNFSPQKLLARIDEMRHSDDEGQLEAWRDTEIYYQTKLRQEKYFNLVGLIQCVTNLEIKQKQSGSKVYKARVFCERFRELSDDELSISDDQLMAYYQENKFKREYQIADNQREVFILHEEVEPTKADTTIAYKKAQDLKKLFGRTKDDSLFVVTHGDFRFYTSGPYSTAVPRDHRKAREGKYLTYPASVADEMESGKIGSIVGPYLYNGNLSIAKIIGRTDDIIEARHILFHVRGTSDDPTYQEAQEFMKTVTNENFAELARAHSADPGSADRGGELGEFFFGDMVPPFATFCTDAPIGEIGLVQTQFGYHIVQVTKRSGKKYPRLAIVTIPVELSQESYSIPKKQLEAFRSMYQSDTINAPTSEKVESAAQRVGAFARKMRILDNSPRMFMIETETAQDHIYRFLYDSSHSIGDISDINDDSLNYYILVHGGINKKGVPPYESVKDQMRSDLLKEKKSRMLKERILSFSSSKKEQKMQEVEITLSNPTIRFCGYEPSVTGRAIHAYHTNQGAIVLSGVSGIFHIEVTGESASEVPDEEEVKAELYSLLKSDIQVSARRALFTLNDIVDNRTFKRLGIRL
jgi:peptidyl-prolyl cis-trans isomerase D